MKQRLILALMLTAALTASAKGKKNVPAPAPAAEPAATAVVLQNALDSAAYAYGVLNGKQCTEWFKQLPAKLNFELFLKAFNQSAGADTTLLMGADEAQRYVEGFAQRTQAAEQEANLAEGRRFMENNRLRPEVKTTPSGLQYEVIREGEGVKPGATSNVTVHYEGKLLNGNVFDSSYQRGEPISFDLNRVIPGWTEGVQLMSPGAKYILYIPQELGYGMRGTGPIPPASTLIFTVELISVN